MILGTAGHIDHGKTTLVRALTGVDTDRLPEEKRRGITIELGFAPLEIDGMPTAGVVDVPGHESFVRTMLAGATGIDVALLVVAADEGVMPQTREHVAILDLLGVQRAVVALTKCDLVADRDWLALVRDDVDGLLASTALAGAPIVETAAATGTGLDELRATIRRLAGDVAPRNARDLLRMPVDRVFTVRGTGTVVTGTIWSGSVRAGDVLQLWPGGRRVRVRALQAHGRAEGVLGAGTRAALALVGVEVADISRGAVVVGGTGWAPTTVIRADVTLLPDAPRALSSRTNVRLHVGTVEVGARIITSAGRLAPGDSRPARIRVDAPVIVRAGDRFVLRDASPAVTIGGGVILDPLPPSRARLWPEAPSLTARLGLIVRESGASGIERASIAVRLGAAPAVVDQLLANESSEYESIGDRIVATKALDEVVESAVGAIERFHHDEPLEVGMPLQLLRARLGVPELVANVAVQQLVAGGRVEVDGAAVRIAAWQPRLDTSQRSRMESLRAALRVAAAEPPGLAELEHLHGPQALALLRYLEREGAIVAVESDRYYDRGALTALFERLGGVMEPGRQYAPTELRDLLGVSRKYLIPLLEHCDRVGYTERRGNGRLWRGPRLETGARTTS